MTRNKTKDNINNPKVLINFSRLSFVFCLLSLVVNISAQQSTDSTEKLRRPRVGVVLSGGGAKGFAHIGVLKVIEEAGLPIDYIAGTSMGSIVGGLYAMGYDTETMIRLTREQNWDAIMSDNIPRKYISIDEKMMDRHYLATFPFRGRRIQMKSGIYGGEMINLLLARLTSPAYDVRNYSNLSVPFLCVATDLETAEAYEMSHGNLQRSIRASMSIPFYFAPVEVDGRLLVDGGLRNNFPVHNVRERDVDIIIGVDVQRDFHKKDDLNSLAKIMDQIIAMTDIDANIKAREEVDIHIKPRLSKYGMMDFNSYDTIIALGEEAAREFLPQMKQLADSIKNIQDYEIKRPHVEPLDTIFVVSLKIDGVKDENAAFIRKSMAKYYPINMSISDIETAIMRIYATGYFKDIWYEFRPAPKGVNLILHCKEKEEETVSIAAHYDTDYGIGILTNVTLKNILKFPKRSTISGDLNIAEDPYFKFRFHSNVSRKFKYGTEASVISLFMNQYDDKLINNSYSIQDNKIDLFAELMPTLEQQFRIGAVLNYVHLRDNLEHTVDADNYDFITYAYLNYNLNNEDSPTYASRGWKLNVNGKYILPMVKLEDGSRMGNSLVVRADLDGSIAMGKRLSMKLGATVGTSLNSNEPPLSYRFFVGGQSYMKYFDNIISFDGLKFTQLYGDHIALAKISWQYNLYKNIYAIANFNGGYVSNSYDEWFTDDNFVFGCGLTLGMNTVAGPIEVSLMGSNRCSGLVGFLNVGYWF
ncbi:MAG: patatin-like phospholipase family protein [Bacteroidales bacterium]|nr:patatin-like phospholipase family protein [Bacteroidales bacterium]